jgi:hypothetical protein
MFESWLSLVDRPSTRFRGTVQPAPQTALSADALTEPRLVLRTKVGEPVTFRDCIRDEMGRVFLVARHDVPLWQRSAVFRLIPMIEQIEWFRAQAQTDLVTGRTREAALVSRGLIWVAREQRGIEQMDRGLKVAEDQLRVFTGARVELGDRLGDAVVKRLVETFGVSVAEIQ